MSSFMKNLESPLLAKPGDSLFILSFFDCCKDLIHKEFF